MLHVLTVGRCFVEVEGAPGTPVQPGDLVLMPHGEGHVLTSTPGLPATKLFETDREAVSERYETLRLGGDGEPATMICGLFKFDDPAAQQLITLLPKIITVDAVSYTHLRAHE